jgi:hypothetical protein
MWQPWAMWDFPFILPYVLHLRGLTLRNSLFTEAFSHKPENINQLEKRAIIRQWQATKVEKYFWELYFP